jgi:hypothetical protein
MRAQLAILESVICIVLLSSASFSLLDSLSSEPLPESSQYQYAIFGLMAAYESNSSMHNCISSGAYSAGCKEILSEAMNIYGIQGISISYKGTSGTFGSMLCRYSKTYCTISVPNASSASYVCIKLCGG